uniref:DNA (cytosine-5-)-methyltransferase n=1 Tax=Siphoviridae sp. ct8Cp41 TaxID=2825358 RepID=A0A8S5UAZ7_9CAUD|nr:MAG TPA: Cytosine specific methyltransferase [Siphoviridae sp. ct8Cp41]
MKHLGNISTINGAEIEPVDVITFGSPCQDLSVAGKRAGLKHEANGDTETTRSGLFMEAIRIITEMREATNGVYPRFAIWENVPGAFSSNKGRDFRIVLEEFIKIVEPEAVMPDVPQGGWARADCYRGDGWSLAYRTLDAQYWGVPQRRRRIYLVADFTGQSAGKILFEREGLRGYFTQSSAEGQGVAGSSETHIGEAGGYCLNDQGGDRMEVSEGVAATLRAEAHGHQPCVLSAVPLENLTLPSAGWFSRGGNVQTLTSRMGTGGNNVPLLMQIRSGCEDGGKGPLIQENKSATLSCANNQTLFEPIQQEPKYTVRKLTPTECARLQGFPDRWGDIDAKSNLTGEEYRFWLGVRNTHASINGKTVKTYTRAQMLAWYSKLHTDSAEYKMWGNGIALPTALYVMYGIGNCLNSK